MGYCMTQTDGSFRMKREKQDAAFKAVKEQMGGKAYHWQEANWMKGVRDIQAVFDAWLYQPETDDETGDIVALEFCAEKLGDELELFKVIAPFVEAGSFLEMRGEDGTMWRWNFNGTECKEQYARVEWDEDEEKENG